jgi:ERCC4-type nuclease
MSKDGLIVVVDTREQKPYRFPHFERKTLITGDYSISGFEDRIAIERKTKEDAYKSFGRDRTRFRREIERLSDFEYGAIVVEASLPDLLRAPVFSRMNPKAVVNSFISWSVKYGVHVFFASDRRYGNALTRRLLEKFWCHRKRKRDAS